MWTGVVVKGYVLHRQPPQVSLTQDDHVIETLASDTAQQTLTGGIGLGSRNGRVQQTDASSFRHMNILKAVLVVVIAD
jgi:hypothetical protein